MARQRRTPVITDRPATRVRSARSGGRSEDSETVVRAMTSALGNTAMAERLTDARERRDALLDFVVARLRILQDAQALERALVDRPEVWERSVARGRSGWVLPDATRWHGAARAYRDVARALARGDLARGVALLEEARSEERAAIESTPSYLPLPTAVREGSDAPVPLAALGVGAREGCPARRLPAEVRIADRILSVSDRAGEVRTLGVPGHTGWWSEASEEEKPEDTKPSPA
ncbi:MAG: hypothetical protein JXB39_12335 [Deltaproteobacteria bacterium]|nr:hypothetical protein [Deltaproteobacteria bacterium]